MPALTGMHTPPQIALHICTPVEVEQMIAAGVETGGSQPVMVCFIARRVC